jgi:hypothetical protein
MRVRLRQGICGVSYDSRKYNLAELEFQCFTYKHIALAVENVIIYSRVLPTSVTKFKIACFEYTTCRPFPNYEQEHNTI